MVLWVGLVLLLVCVVAFAVGLILYANGHGVAPQQRTKGDPTGFRRAGSHVEWSDVFRQMPRSLSVFSNEDNARGDRLEAAGSLLVLIALVAALLATLALVAILL